MAGHVKKKNHLMTKCKFYYVYNMSVYTNNSKKKKENESNEVQKNDSIETL